MWWTGLSRAQCFEAVVLFFPRYVVAKEGSPVLSLYTTAVSTSLTGDDDKSEERERGLDNMI